jgi:hypothetical protein
MSSKARYRLAVHEAGHAVVTLAEYLPLDFVTISSSLARTVSDHPMAAMTIGISRRANVFSEPSQEIRIVLAGMEAERQILGWRNGGWRHMRPWGDTASMTALLGSHGADHHDLFNLLEEVRRNAREAGKSDLEIEKTVKGFRHSQQIRCERLVRRYRRQIEDVATALIERETLNGSEVEAICGDGFPQEDGFAAAVEVALAKAGLPPIKA